MADQRIQLDDQRIDQLVAFCSRLIQTHATGDVETILFGLGCLAQMAKERPQQPEDVQRRLDAALNALHLMVEQYCEHPSKKTEDGKPVYMDMCMTAPEEACQVLRNEERITEDQWE